MAGDELPAFGVSDIQDACPGVSVDVCELEKRAGEVKTKRGAKSTLVETAMESFPGDFTLADVERACPGVSRDLIRRLLWQKQKDGLLECLNRGPGAIWRRKVKII